MNTGQRIMARLTALKMSQAELARRVGITQPSINHLIKRGSGNSAHLHKIARVLQTSPEYLTGETDNPDATAGVSEQQSPYRSAPADVPDTSGMVMIKEADLVLGFGGTFLDSPVEERMIPFPIDWLRQFSKSSPEHLVFIRGRGESMKPTVLDGDICLLDLGRKRIDEQDELWAVAYGNIGMVKRLRAMPDGTVKIMSDNPSVDPEVAYDGELHVIGRCCGVFRKT